ncbi:MAG: cysteine desulfurase [Provencibacterium sp.]|jgi:cysteine desulfurase|nr:cysteine desulfurase [Provencibacterium sp.]
MGAEKKNVYLDNAATTRCDPEAARLVTRLLTEEYGNPSSLHAMGFAAEQCVERARAQVARLLGCRPEEILFTSGATEANNLAVIGAARALRRRGNRIAVSAVEHASVLEAAHALAHEGFETSAVSPGPDGKIDPEEAAGAVDEKTAVFSCMLVNNETGTVNDIAAIAAAVKRKNPRTLVHCDAVQGAGKLPLNLKRLPIDLLSLSGHKLYAPKGIGALYLRGGTRVLPLLYGGAQQSGLRPGTENTAYIAALGFACERAGQEMEARWQKAELLNRAFREKILLVEGACINSPPDAAPYIVNVSFPGLRSETLLHFLEQRGISVSSGSACKKGARSHVLEAMGLSPARIDSALRISFCPDNTLEDVDFAAACIREGAATLARARR